MMTKTIIMLSGIPRSGSQVLASLLNQHPLIHATPTSPVVDMISILDSNWHQISQNLVDPDPDQYPNMLRGLIQGAYQHVDKPVIVDKNRIWPRSRQLMTAVLGYRPKVICTVRSIPEVLASYILLVRRNSHKITYIDQDLMDMNVAINDFNRCQLLWQRYLAEPYMTLKNGLTDGFIDPLIVDYHDIVDRSQETMDRITGFIGIHSHVVTLDALKPMPENDSYHGGLEGLHDVRSQMRQTSPDPSVVLGEELVKIYADQRLDFWNTGNNIGAHIGT
jgi:sulfotransferase